MASSSEYVKKLKKDIVKGKDQSINSDRKTIMIKLPVDEYNNLTKFINLVNSNTKEKVTKQSVVYKVLSESGLLDNIEDDK